METMNTMNTMNTEIVIATSPPPELWRIEMLTEGGWQKLGGKFDAHTADRRIDQFMQHFMFRPPGSSVTECKRQFRRVKIG